MANGKDTLTRLLPLLTFGTLAATQGRSAAGGFGQAFGQQMHRQRSLGLQEQGLDLRRQQVESLDAYRQQQVEAQELTARARHRADEMKFIQSAMDKADEFESADEYISFLRAQEQFGVSRGLITPGALSTLPVPRRLFARKQSARARQQAERIVETHGRAQLNAMLEAPRGEQPRVQFEGDLVPLEQFLAQYAGSVIGADGNVVPFEDTPANRSTFETRLQLEREAFTAREGRDPGAQEAAALARTIDGANSLQQQIDLLRAQLLANQLELSSREVSGKRPSTPVEKTTMGFATRAASGHTAAMSFEDRLLSMGAQMATRLPNFLQSQESQQYLQAQREFTEARLRKESGAAIPDSEFRNDARTYFVQPGDTPATVLQKQLARARLLQSLAFQAGPAWVEFMGSPFDYSEYVPATETEVTDGDEESAQSAIDLLRGLR